MKSSQEELGSTLAESRLLWAVRELVNTRDDNASATRFLKRYPEFFGDVPTTIPLVGPGGATGTPSEHVPLELIVLNVVAALKRIWRSTGERHENHLLTALLTIDDPMAAIREANQQATGSPVVTPRQDFVRARIMEHASVWADWRRGQFVHAPRTEFQKALYALLQNSWRARVCANPDCPAPYFLAAKGMQRYCSDGCSVVFQREWKRRWWAMHREEQNAARSKKAKSLNKRGHVREKKTARHL